MPGAGDTLTITVIRSGGPDRWGNVNPISTQHTVDGCLFAPGPSREIGFQANEVRTDGTVYGPPDADVVATDLVVVRGDTYTVVGNPQNWGSSGTVIVLRAWTG